jgi:predicted dienelactone hydrolase
LFQDLVFVGHVKRVVPSPARASARARIDESAPVSNLKMKPASARHELSLTRPTWALAVALMLLLAACGGGVRRTAQQQAATGTTMAHGAAANETDDRHSGRDPTLRPPFRVGSVSPAVHEPASAAIATTRTATGTPVRVLPTVVRYPAIGRPNGRANPRAAPARAAGPFPLLVFSQGYDMPSAAYSWLMNAWTSAGYVVAAPTYPHTNPTSPGGPDEADIVNHPADLRSVIATLQKSQIPGAREITNLIDPSRVAVIGQSDGGDVSLAVAAGSCCRDRTVKAAVILSGAELAAFGGSYYSTGSAPLLVVQGTADTINPPGCSIELYDQAPRPKYYLELVGAAHLQPYVDPGRDRALVATAVLDFLGRYLDGRASGIRKLARDGNAPAQASLTTRSTGPGSETYCPGAPAP